VLAGAAVLLLLTGAMVGPYVLRVGHAVTIRAPAGAYQCTGALSRGTTVAPFYTRLQETKLFVGCGQKTETLGVSVSCFCEK
jgi:hypothetical protein